MSDFVDQLFGFNRLDHLNDFEPGEVVCVGALVRKIEEAVSYSKEELRRVEQRKLAEVARFIYANKGAIETTVDVLMYRHLIEPANPWVTDEAIVGLLSRGLDASDIEVQLVSGLVVPPSVESQVMFDYLYKAEELYGDVRAVSPYKLSVLPMVYKDFEKVLDKVPLSDRRNLFRRLLYMIVNVYMPEAEWKNLERHKLMFVHSLERCPPKDCLKVVMQIRGYCTYRNSLQLAMLVRAIKAVPEEDKDGVLNHSMSIFVGFSGVWNDVWSGNIVQSWWTLLKRIPPSQRMPILEKLSSLCDKYPKDIFFIIDQIGKFLFEEPINDNTALTHSFIELLQVFPAYENYPNLLNVVNFFAPEERKFALTEVIKYCRGDFVKFNAIVLRLTPLPEHVRLAALMDLIREGL